MSNGKNWRSYLAIIKDPVHVEHYLSNLIYGTSGRVYFEGLMEDTDLSRPPTREWYRLHLIAVTKERIQSIEDMWPTDVIAWGLNIWESDLIHMQRSLMQKFACMRCRTSQEGGPGHAGVEQPMADLFGYSLVEAAYKCMRSRFPLSLDSLGNDYEWQTTAMHRIVISSWKNALLALGCGYYNETDGRSTETGDANWQELLAYAAKNDRRHGLDTETVSHKRVMQDDDYEPSSKRAKATQDTASTNKRRAEDGSEDRPEAKRQALR